MLEALLFIGLGSGGDTAHAQMAVVTGQGSSETRSIVYLGKNFEVTERLRANVELHGDSARDYISTH